MRLRAFLPAYLLLAVAVAYALGSLWTGLDRLDAIQLYTESSDRSERAVTQLESVLTTALDLEVGGRGYVLTGDEDYLASFERARKRAPDLLAELRGIVRDQPVKLAQVEQLVPLLAELIAVTNSGIERRRASRDPTAPPMLDRRDKETFDRIRDTLIELLAGERVELAHHRDTLLAAQRSAKRDAFIVAGFMLALVAALFLALRRIRDFVHPRPSGVVRQDSESDAPSSHHAALDTLLRDAQMRVQVAMSDATPDTAAQAHLKALQRSLERALIEHLEVGRDLDHPVLGTLGLPEALGMLASRYSGPNRLTVNAVVDLSANVGQPEAAHLVCRSAEWALEVIARRKRAGEVRLDCARENDSIALRVAALVDDAARAIELTPREQESAGVLRSAIAGRGGSFDLAGGPTGLIVSAKLPDR